MRRELLMNSEMGKQAKKNFDSEINCPTSGADESRHSMPETGISDAQTHQLIKHLHLFLNI